MRILGCIVKSVTTFVCLAVIVVLAGATLPHSPGATRFLGVLAIISALAWVTLTGWWLLRLRPPRHRPQQELRTLQIPGPRIGLAVLCVPVVLGVMAVLAQTGISVPVLVRAIISVAFGVLLHRRRLRSLSKVASPAASPATHTIEAGEKTE